MTMVLEAKTIRETSPLLGIPDPQTQEPASSDLFDSAIESLHHHALEHDLRLSEREVVSILSLSHLLQQGKVDAKICLQFVLHLAYLTYLPISNRRISDVARPAEKVEFIDMFASCARTALRNSAVIRYLEHSDDCDLADLLDARLFFALDLAQVDEMRSSSFLHARYAALIAALELTSGTTLLPPCNMNGDTVPIRQIQDQESDASGSLQFEDTVMPFNDPIFDRHLAPINISVDKTDSSVHQSGTSSRIFKEITHWHTARRPLVQKGYAEQLSSKALRRNQFFMSEMQNYAASLTNAAGKVLKPEVIIASGRGNGAKVHLNQPEIAKKEAKHGQGKKAGQNNKKGGKASAMEAAAAAKANRSDQQESKFFRAWDGVCTDLQQIDSEERVPRIEKYIQGLTKEAAALVGAEVELFKICSLFELWIRIRNSAKLITQLNAEHLRLGEAYVALIWDSATRLSRDAIDVAKSVATTINEILSALGLPTLSFSLSSIDRKLSFKIRALQKVKLDKIDVSVPRSPLEFQLQHCGPYFDRSMDAAPDSRVLFEPDGWQRKVLDAIEAGKSLLVVAPTSAGKTFISFFAMKQVLDASDEDILVYVAPTKALVNQIAAEVQARFAKNYRHAGRSVWGIHTRDYRINNPTGCQILVTVPHILQIMLLSPTNALAKNSWSNRVKRIIFDEVHCIGQADDGLIWEQLLLLAPCPIIALSATVGNPVELSSWLADTQRAIKNDFVMIKHDHRYSDLRKFTYLPPQRFNFEPLKKQSDIPIPGLDGSSSFAFVHPIASLVDRSRGIPEDLSLEARDCLLLYNSLERHQTQTFKLNPELHPLKSLPKVVRKPDILKWESELKTVVQQLMKTQESVFDQVVLDLGQSVIAHKHTPDDNETGHNSRTVDSNSLQSTTLPLLAQLHKTDALPAIVFNYARNQCEVLAQEVMRELEASETAWKASDAGWQKKLAAFQQWTESQEKAAEKVKKAPSAKAKKSKNAGEEDDRGSKLDTMRESGDIGSTTFARFDADAPVDGFHFADWKKLLPSELEDYQYQLHKWKVPKWLVDLLSRGIGVHHSGMNRKYRQVVEILFRKGFLRVVFATGTLALGINMPCKTVVFSGDSVFLTALNFRQAAGRAGRRGFDVLGNVVFQGINFSKVCRLLSSRLPDLNGHFPITTSLVLRLFSLLQETQHSPYATRAIDSLLSQPRLYLGGGEAKHKVLHHLRFSIEYLRRQGLLSSTGVPLNFAGCIGHLSYVENAGFAFHALLKEGYFHSLCSDLGRNQNDVLLELMLVMAHLFGRLQWRQADEENRGEVVKRSSSIVFLPAMPGKAQAILVGHNEETLNTFRTYVKSYVNQHIKDADNKLPFTGLKFGGDLNTSKSPNRLPQSLPGTELRSPFVATSGHGDEFNSISDLCHTVRAGVFLEESVVPHISLFPQDTEASLNAYLYDFYKHGDVTALNEANRIRSGDVWFLLNGKFWMRQIYQQTVRKLTI
jgi:hypothetical protein